MPANFNLNMNVLDKDGVPRVMSLKEVLKAFLDHNRFGVNVNSFRFTVAFDITIGGLLYRLASTQISELLVQKLPIECRRVVEVDPMTFFLGHLRGIVII